MNRSEALKTIRESGVNDEAFAAKSDVYVLAYAQARLDGKFVEIEREEPRDPVAAAREFELWSERLDGWPSVARLDFDPDQPRDEHGQFGEGGGGGGGDRAVAAEGRGQQSSRASENHGATARSSAKQAGEHAKVARDLAKANPTSAAHQEASAKADRAASNARGAARKAEAAKTPGEAAKHVTAAQAHASTAASHVAAVQGSGFKAGTHMPNASAKQRAQEALDSSKAAAKAGEIATASDRPLDHAEAATAHRQAAQAAEKAGLTDLANTHKASEALHGGRMIEKFGENKRETPGALRPDRQAGARALTEKANAASNKATDSGTAEHHMAAAEAHGNALVEHRALGNSTQMREHGRAMDRHENAARGHESGSRSYAGSTMGFGQGGNKPNFADPISAAAGDRRAAAGGLTDKANAASRTAMTSGKAADHAAAIEAHGDALVEHRALGNSAQMRDHGHAMDRHEVQLLGAEKAAKAAENPLAADAEHGRFGQWHADPLIPLRANAATEKARRSGNAADHRAAHEAHSTAAEAAKGRGDKVANLDHAALSSFHRNEARVISSAEHRAKRGEDKPASFSRLRK